MPLGRTARANDESPAPRRIFPQGRNGVKAMILRALKNALTSRRCRRSTPPRRRCRRRRSKRSMLIIATMPLIWRRCRSIAWRGRAEAVWRYFLLLASIGGRFRWLDGRCADSRGHYFGAVSGLMRFSRRVGRCRFGCRLPSASPRSAVDWRFTMIFRFRRKRRYASGADGGERSAALRLLRRPPCASGPRDAR